MGFSIALIVFSLLLMLLVLMHKGKGGGLSDMFGGGMQSSVGGSSVAERNLDRITVVVGLLWFACIVVLGITRELGPVLGGLMVAGRVSAAMAAEIGTMRVTEQIDALVTLSTNPHKYLVAPRLIAGLLMLPCLVIVANIIGVFGGFLISVYRLGDNPSAYITATWQALEVEDVVLSLMKAAAFGFVVALMGCYHGYNSRGGAQGVGAATTNAVVSSSILILLFDFMITGLYVG